MTQIEESGAAEAATTVTVEPAPIGAYPSRGVQVEKGSLSSLLLRTTDHKLIGRMYLVTSLVFFLLGGIMALLMRAELARPGMQFLSTEQ